MRVRDDPAVLGLRVQCLVQRTTIRKKLKVASQAINPRKIHKGNQSVPLHVKQQECPFGSSFYVLIN